ncbi:MAG: peptide chain release factor N(5)-glutamine methyltransferase [Rikenellaceae bacterium]
MTRRQLYEQLVATAEPIYGTGEAQQIARMIVEELWGVSRIEMIANPDVEVDTTELERVTRELAASRPVQYIIGEADFCDFRLRVREGVLIPRPESEELIRWVVSESHDSVQRIVDVGTGSGALAIALSRKIEGAEVTAIDISQTAIEIARENIAQLAPDVAIVEGDALRGIEAVVEARVDIIISNPPYIPRSEIEQMRDNVVLHEPHVALFVEDSDPLIFYREIAKSGLKLLRSGGRLYFEIHENFATECRDMLSQMGYTDVRIRLDINDKARMVCAQKE